MAAPSEERGDAESLAALLARARERWPAITVDAAAFLRHLGGRTELQAALQTGTALDLYLAFACLSGDRAALAAFDQEHLRPVGAYVAHVDRSPAFAQEVRQALRAKLLAAAPPGLQAYAARGPLGGWVRVAALRLALNLKRSERRCAAREAAAGAEPVAGVGPELSYLRERYRDDFVEALRQAVAVLGDRDRALLRLYHGEGLALEPLAALYRVHPSTVSRWLACAREQISSETMRRLRQRLGASDSEAGSIAALLLSQVDASLLRLLGAQP